MIFQPTDVPASTDQPQWTEPLQLDLPLQARLQEIEETIRAKLKGRVRDLPIQANEIEVV